MEISAVCLSVCLSISTKSLGQLLFGFNLSCIHFQTYINYCVLEGIVLCWVVAGNTDGVNEKCEMWEKTEREMEFSQWRRNNSN